jgi:hypothetical protein
MSDLGRIWIAMRTRSNENSGTDSRINLFINQAGTDVFDHTFGDSLQRDQETGQANIYYRDVPLGSGLLSYTLGFSSARIGIRGDDQWRPEDIFVWGERRWPGSGVVPMTMEAGIETRLSTDLNEGALSLPLRPVGRLDYNTPIRRLLMLMLTANVNDAGTNSPIALQIGGRGGSILDFQVPDTPQDDQERAQANWYYVPVPNPFFTLDLVDASVRLLIRGTDAWLPRWFFLFGLDSDEGRPNDVISIVNVTDWTFGWMSTDSSEGVGSVNLPLT